MLQHISGQGAELLEHSAEYTLVKSDQELKSGSRITVRLRGVKGKQTVPIAMRVVSCRPCAEGGFLWAGQCLDRPDFGGIELPQRPHPNCRARPRFGCSLCVLSPQLPGYRVLAVDISEGGAQVETSGDVTSGTKISLRIEFDVDLPIVSVTAVVRWSREASPGKFRIGLEFSNLDDSALSIIRRYQTILKQRKIPA